MNCVSFRIKYLFSILVYIHILCFLIVPVNHFSHPSSWGQLGYEHSSYLRNCYIFLFELRGGGFPRVWRSVPRVWTSVLRIWSSPRVWSGVTRVWNGCAGHKGHLTIEIHKIRLLLKCESSMTSIIQLCFFWCSSFFLQSPFWIWIIVFK